MHSDAIMMIGDSYLKYDSGLNVYVGSTSATRGLSVTSTGGTLHGAWVSDVQVAASDRRLKRDIMPVDEAVSALGVAPADVSESSLSWVMRALRPVAYHFKRGVESKYQRYGFIADEVAQLLPDIARPLDPTQKDDPIVGLVYSDLIALLVAQLQRHDARLAAVEVAQPPPDRMARLEETVAILQRQVAERAESDRVARLEAMVAALQKQVRDLESRCGT
jgi:hypothetical protein